MVAKNVAYDITENLGIITIKRPWCNNAINTSVIEELIYICNCISIDENVRVVIITGAGEKAFSIGIDDNELQQGSPEQETVPRSIASPIANLKCPTIAAINGDALGQGMEMALACDLRIASETARFALPHYTSGLACWDGATQRLPRLIGMTKAMEMILTGEIIDAQEASRIGLVNIVVKPDELITTAKNLALTMASQSPLALSFAKEAINSGIDLTLEQGLRLEADLYFLLQTSHDRVEGIRAFLDKRTPDFKGE